MLPAALRRRLSAVLNPQQDLGVSQDLTQSFGHDYHCPSSTATPRPASASSKESTISISSNASGYSTPDLEKPQTLTTYESNSGLRWNRVSPAFSLLRSAAYEAQQLDPDTRLVRSLFIDGVGYLLEALPADLTDEEARSFYDRLPGSVKKNVDNTPRSPSPRNSTPPPSYLHRMIATVIVYGFIVVQLVLPYARMLLNTIYTYERRHRVTERAFAAALQLADGVGKGAGNIEPALTRLGDGGVLPRVYSLTAWTMESIAGGVYDGVSKGIAELEGGSYHARKT